MFIILLVLKNKEKENVKKLQEYKSYIFQL